MDKMQESEFEKIIFKKQEDKCEHHVVKLYGKSINTDYGCTLCGKLSTNKADFKKSAR